MFEYFRKIDSLADSHGIPSIRGIYNAAFGNITYNFNNLKERTYKTIPKELLSYIDDERFRYVNKLKNYLGNKYVGLPSIISIILDRSKNLEDIPNQMLILREELTNFRNYGTELHYQLRTSDSFLESTKIIDEIENKSYSFDFNGQVKYKYRLSQIIPDISLDPLSTCINIVKKLDELIQLDKLKLKQIGYYDLRNKAFDVQHNLKALKRIFNTSINDDFITRLNNLLSCKQY